MKKVLNNFLFCVSLFIICFGIFISEGFAVEIKAANLIPGGPANNVTYVDGKSGSTVITTPPGLRIDTFADSELKTPVYCVQPERSRANYYTREEVFSPDIKKIVQTAYKKYPDLVKNYGEGYSALRLALIAATFGCNPTDKKDAAGNVIAEDVTYVYWNSSTHSANYYKDGNCIVKSISQAGGEISAAALFPELSPNDPAVKNAINILIESRDNPVATSPKIKEVNVSDGQLIIETNFPSSVTEIKVIPEGQAGNLCSTGVYDSEINGMVYTCDYDGFSNKFKIKSDKKVFVKVFKYNPTENYQTYYGFIPIPIEITFQLEPEPSTDCILLTTKMKNHTATDDEQIQYIEECTCFTTGVRKELEEKLLCEDEAYKYLTDEDGMNYCDKYADESYCPKELPDLSYCEPDYDLTSNCADALPSNNDGLTTSLSMYYKDPSMADLVKKCDNKDQWQENDFDSDYCDLYCREDIDLIFPSERYTTSGRFFYVQAKIYQKRDCTTGVINTAKFQSDYDATNTDAKNAIDHYQYGYWLKNDINISNLNVSSYDGECSYESSYTETKQVPYSVCGSGDCEYWSHAITNFAGCEENSSQCKPGEVLINTWQDKTETITVTNYVSYQTSTVGVNDYNAYYGNVFPTDNNKTYLTYVEDMNEYNKCTSGLPSYDAQLLSSDPKTKFWQENNSALKNKGQPEMADAKAEYESVEQTRDEYVTKYQACYTLAGVNLIDAEMTFDYESGDSYSTLSSVLTGEENDYPTENVGEATAESIGFNQAYRCNDEDCNDPKLVDGNGYSVVVDNYYKLNEAATTNHFTSRSDYKYYLDKYSRIEKSKEIIYKNSEGFRTQVANGNLFYDPTNADIIDQTIPIDIVGYNNDPLNDPFGHNPYNPSIKPVPLRTETGQYRFSYQMNINGGVGDNANNALNDALGNPVEYVCFYYISNQIYCSPEDGTIRNYSDYDYASDRYQFYREQADDDICPPEEVTKHKADDYNFFVSFYSINNFNPNGRELGSNWSETDVAKAAGETDEMFSITTANAIADNGYYKFVLTPMAIQYIRNNYNTSSKYSDFNLQCSQGKKCYSVMITELINRFSDLSDFKFGNLSTARTRSSNILWAE